MTFPAPLLHGFHAAADLVLWIGGFLTGLVAVALLLGLLAWALGLLTQGRER